MLLMSGFFCFPVYKCIKSYEKMYLDHLNASYSIENEVLSSTNKLIHK